MRHHEPLVDLPQSLAGKLLPSPVFRQPFGKSLADDPIAASIIPRRRLVQLISQTEWDIRRDYSLCRTHLPSPSVVKLAARAWTFAEPGPSRRSQAGDRNPTAQDGCSRSASRFATTAIHGSCRARWREMKNLGENMIPEARRQASSAT